MPTDTLWVSVQGSDGSVLISSDPAPVVRAADFGTFIITYPVAFNLTNCGLIATINNGPGMVAASHGGANQVTVKTFLTDGSTENLDFTLCVLCPPSTPRVVAFVSVNQDGSVRRSSDPAISVTRLDVGFYSVDFATIAEIGSCVFVATLSRDSAQNIGLPVAGEISISSAPTGDAQAVGMFVFTFNSSGPLGFAPPQSDRGFDLIAVRT